LSEEDFDTIIHDLGKVFRRASIAWLRTWLVAGIHTGLWPHEWSASAVAVRPDPERLSRRRAWLHVLPLNKTSRPAHKPSRTLDISDFSDDAFEAVRMMIEYGAQWKLDGIYEQRYSDCAELLYEFRRRAFPRRTVLYSLYFLRSQFVADCHRALDDSLP
jgi:hypothetical protein